MTRRDAVRLIAAAAPAYAAAPYRLSPRDDRFLDDLSRRCFRYFVEHAHPRTGLVRDRARTNGDPVRRKDGFDIASIAATGFGLTALCIGVERGWIPRAEAERKTLETLNFFDDRAKGKNGWFYHFVEFATGERRWNCEASSIDTALFLAGALTARQYFANNKDIVKRATRLYEQADFKWMLDGNPYLLSHGWYPEKGFIGHRWRRYSEHTILYLMAIGSPGRSIPAGAWYAWERPVWTYENKYTYISSVSPLFIHQYSHAWVDYRGKRELRPNGINYFENSITATRAHREFCISLRSRFPKSYSSDIWGITASDSANGYRAWGGPPPDPEIDGTVVPCAPGGSLMFAPEIAVPSLRAMAARFGKRIFGRYGFTDAFNPTTGWVNPDVIGIDTGITLLSAENLRSGFVWTWFMRNPEIGRAMAAAEFGPDALRH